MKHLRTFSLALAFAFLGGHAPAEEGMWLFNNVPDSVRQEIRQKYNFDLSTSFLDRLRTGSVHFGGGSGSFVSPEGLLFTNHHIASSCVQNLSSKEHDYMSEGFYAKSKADEAKCPGMRVRVLLEIQDVTARVQSKGAASPDHAEGNRLRKAEMAEIENSCSAKGFDCQVVTLYAGGKYNLYRYKEYDDIRLVFAPEMEIAFFGGDPDNFNFPRYCLDISFLRAYENGVPAKPEGYLSWSKRGAQVGQLQFVSGHPGSTGRLNTLSQLEFSRDLSYPLILERLESLIATAKKYAEGGEEAKRVAMESIFGFQNSQKAYAGFLSGLRDDSLMAEKREQENALRAAVSKNGELERKYGKVWSELADAMQAYRTIYKPLLLKETYMGRGSDLFLLARLMDRYATEIEKPNELRLNGFNDASLPNIRRRVEGRYPIYKEFEAGMLANSLAALQRAFPNDATIKQVLDNRSPLEAAEAYIRDSKLDDQALRTKMMENPELIRESKDPIFELVRLLETDCRALLSTYHDEIESVSVDAETKIAQARFGVYGENDYPDATLTLRLAYGPLRGFDDDKNRFIPPFTTLGGIFDKATGADPYILPESWKKARGSLDMNLPFNYVTTADIHGGNSGSPAVDTKGEVVGIVFDGNLPSLPNRFIYQDRSARAVFVSSQVVVEALDKIYAADRILEELGLSRSSR